MENGKELEKEELELLRGKGFEIKLKILFWIFIFHSKKMTLKRLLDLSSIFLKMEINHEALVSEDYQVRLSEQYHVVNRNAKKASEVIAICICDSWVMRKVLRYFIMKNFTSENMLEFSHNLLKMASFSNFISSIVLIDGNRPTKATTIEV